MTVKLNGSGPVVVVDDDRFALQIAKAVFEESKVSNQLLLMESGTQLLDYLEQVNSGAANLPAIVLLDLNMPEINGHETLKAVRAQNAFRSVPTIVMFTVSNYPEDERKALAEGANYYKVKPFELEEFIQFANSLVA